MMLSPYGCAHIDHRQYWDDYTNNYLTNKPKECRKVKSRLPDLNRGPRALCPLAGSKANYRPALCQLS